MAARDVIMEGSRWRVGNGRQIWAESRNWLSHKPIFRREEWPNLRVGNLIDDRDWEWKRTMIAEIFAPRTCEEINAIPLGRERTQDALIWKENRKHEFSVESAYHVALRLNKHEVTEHSQAGADGKLWKKVWKLNVPPKVRTFMWRACADTLPTRDNLHRRRVGVDRNCEFCRQQPKTGAHLLWECPFARNVWSLSSGKVQKCRNEVWDFFQLFRALEEKLTMKELEQWATIAWGIWNARNRAHFEKIQTQPQTILDGSIDLLTSYHTHSQPLKKTHDGETRGPRFYGGCMLFHWYKEMLA